MKRYTLMLFVLVTGFAAAIARADWGHGLGGECKTNTVNIYQQSGWACTGAKAVVQQTKVETPAAAPVVAAPAQTEPAKVVAAPVAVPEKKWVLEGVQFESGSDKLKPESQASLDKAAEILKAHNNVTIEIQGHTDSTGKAAYNESLSQKRAQAVKKYLTDQGVSEQRMEARGYGQALPIADNATPAGRAENRRIEFKVLSR